MGNIKMFGGNFFFQDRKDRLNEIITIMINEVTCPILLYTIIFFSYSKKFIYIL